MILKAEDISNRPLRKKMGGYKSKDVDELVEEVKVAYDGLQRENHSLLEKVKKMKTELSSYKEREDLIQSAIINAQKSAELSIREANYKADMIIKEAKEKADSLIIKIKYEVRDEEKTLKELKEKSSDFRLKLLENYKEHIKLIGILPIKEEEEESATLETQVKTAEPPIRITDVSVRQDDEEISKETCSDACTQNSDESNEKKESLCKKYTVKSLDKFTDLKFGNSALEF